MRVFSTTALCAFCALPSLVQPAMAQQEGETALRYAKLFAASVQLTQEFVNIILSLDDHKISADEATKKVRNLNRRFGTVMQDLEAAGAAMTPRERKAITDKLKEPQMVKVINELDRAVKNTRGILILKDYYNNPRLKAACERYFTK